LYDRDPTRAIVPVTAGQIDTADFDPEAGWLFLDDFKRIEAPGYKPYPVAEAARRLLRALALTPVGEVPGPVTPQPTESVDDLVTRGRALIAQNKFAEALALFERATQLAPNSFETWGNLGHVLAELRDWEQALDACDKALKLNDKQAWVWNNMGWALTGLGRYEDALAACERALEINPNYARSWRRKGYVLYKLQHHVEALEAYNRALAFNPHNARAWHQKALVSRALGRDAEAEAAEHRARELGWTG
jgi:tetratricopeptide (TPR) repeat protein